MLKLSGSAFCRLNLSECHRLRPDQHFAFAAMLAIPFFDHVVGIFAEITVRVAHQDQLVSFLQGSQAGCSYTAMGHKAGHNNHAYITFAQLLLEIGVFKGVGMTLVDSRFSGDRLDLWMQLPALRPIFQITVGGMLNEKHRHTFQSSF